jgi:hypothetical protein
MALRGMSYLLTAALTFSGVMALSFLSDYMLNSAEDRFGTEVAGWRYYSARNFVSFAIFELVLVVVGLVVSLRMSSRMRRVVVQAIVLVVVISAAVVTA